MTPIHISLLILALAACDTAEREVVEAVPGGPTVSTGTFTALLNGEPYEAPAAYFADDRGFFYLQAVQVDSSLRPPYRQELQFHALGSGFIEGEERALRSPEGPGSFGVLEIIADGILQAHLPVAGGAGGLKVVEADSAAGRFRATFEGTFAATGPRVSEYQRLPDTLRFTNGEFVIDLATE